MKAVVIHAAEGPAHRGARAGGRPAPARSRSRIEAGGICGSDLHYYNARRLRHGAAARADDPRARGRRHGRGAGRGVSRASRSATGVAVNPSRPCGACRYCLQGQQNHCLDMRFYGSAMPLPHVQGALPPDAGLRGGAVRTRCCRTACRPTQAAFAEPLAVVPACGRTAPGRCWASACWSPAPGRSARSPSSPRGCRGAGDRRDRLSATPLLDRRGGSAPTAPSMSPSDADALRGLRRRQGQFRRACSRPPATARRCAPASRSLRPRGVLVQLGLGGDVTPAAEPAWWRRRSRCAAPSASTRSSRWRSSCIGRGAVDLDAAADRDHADRRRRCAAFELAGDRSRAMKVQLAF